MSDQELVSNDEGSFQSKNLNGTEVKKSCSGDSITSNNTRDKSLIKLSKEDKSLDRALKALQSLTTPEEKLVALCKKYAELMATNKALQTTNKEMEKRNQCLDKEREHLQAENNKAILSRSRLESLCRELQRQNKIVKEESMLRVREEEEKRKEVSTKFQGTLTEISNLIQESNQKNIVLRQENAELAVKLNKLIEQCDLRDKHAAKVMEQREIENKLAEAKLAKANMLLAEHRELHLKEKKALVGDLQKYQEKCELMITNEMELRQQLGTYTDKYSAFQSSLAKSNEIFISFKDEMDKMTKKVSKMEKENGNWKIRWENSNGALLAMAEDKQTQDGELLLCRKKIVQLENLCRALQAERHMLKNQLTPLETQPNDLPISSTEEVASCASPVNKDISSGGLSAAEPIMNMQTSHGCPMDQPISSVHTTEEINSIDSGKIPEK